MGLDTRASQPPTRHWPDILLVLEPKFGACHSFLVSAPKYFPVKDHPHCFQLNVLYIASKKKKLRCTILKELQAHRYVINFASVPPYVSPWVVTNGCRSHRVPQKWYSLTVKLSFWTDWPQNVHWPWLQLWVQIFFALSWQAEEFCSTGLPVKRNKKEVGKGKRQ